MNIFLLHRDFRIKDNTALYELAKHDKYIYLFFIFNKKQIEKNDFFSCWSFQYMVKALKQLNSEIKVNFFKVDNELDLFEKIINDGIKIKRIYWNKDFTPFALKRSQKLEAFAIKHGIEIKTPNDYLLLNPDNDEDFISAKVFSLFWKKIIPKLSEKCPLVKNNIKIKALEYSNNLTFNIDTIKFNKDILFPIKRSEVINSIISINKNYEKNRDMLFLDENSKISPAIKFGIISIREIIQLSKKRFETFENAYTRQIIWREFFYHCHIQSGRKKLGENILLRYDKFNWNYNKKQFKAWCESKTGFKIIDAAMNQLKTTGYMHNRARMITASFLTKNLLIDWRWGERYFAKNLVDYDPIVNNLSWQWVAGTGFETNPFFRIFNPFLQEKKFDPNGDYIKKWLPENYNFKEIIDYKKSRENALKIYKETFKKNK